MKPYKGQQSKSQQIKYMFDKIAPSYDFLNHLLSFGLDYSMRASLRKEIKRRKPKTIADIATGTGDVAISLAKACPEAQILGVDLSSGMIEKAAEKIKNKKLEDRIKLRVAPIEDLDMDEEKFDAVTAAFGVRNFGDIPKGLTSMINMLNEGGVIAVLEFSTPKSKIFGALYRFYFHRVLPFIGGIFSRDNEAYRYLPESVAEFPEPKDFAELLKTLGIREVKAKSLIFGVAHLYIGEK